MSNLHLVTGYAGQAHVTAADDGSFNTAIFGSGQYVFDIGSKFAASVVSNNKITIADGDLLMQGRHVRLNEGTTVDLTINNGAQGKLRNDLIVARYTKDSVSGVEEVNLVVIQGTAVDSDPVDPEYTSGDIINDHALLNDMPLYRVPLDGLTVGTPVALFELASVKNSDANLADAVCKKHEHTNKTTLDTYDKTQTELLQLGCNPNLLDNWYFPNPVNQRGASSYSGATVYSIDRWICNNVSYTCASQTVTAAGDEWAMFYQRVEYVPQETMTFSVLMADGSLYTLTTDCSAYAWVTTSFGSLFANQREASGLGVFGLKFHDGSEGTSITITAAKLELGGQQTLAHKDANGNWVLNEVPNYAEQLARCQRYYFKITGEFSTGHNLNGRGVVATITTPVAMRTTPTTTVTTAQVFCNNPSIAWYSLTFSYTYSISAAQYDLSFSSTGGAVLNSGDSYLIRLTAALSAEL